MPSKATLERLREAGAGCPFFKVFGAAVSSAVASAMDSAMESDGRWPKETVGLEVEEREAERLMVDLEDEETELERETRRWCCDCGCCWGY